MAAEAPRGDEDIPSEEVLKLTCFWMTRMRDGSWRSSEAGSEVDMVAVVSGLRIPRLREAEDVRSELTGLQSAGR